MNRTWKTIGKSVFSPVHNKNRKEIEIKTFKKERIVIIGSEHQYDSFWLKMMFIGAATSYLRLSKGKADKTTIAYVSYGYTNLEIGVLEYWCNHNSFDVFKLCFQKDLIKLMNKDRDEYKIINLIIFSHGYPKIINLNYKGDEDIVFDASTLNMFIPTAFALDGKIFSYACRTGISHRTCESFYSDNDAQPQHSLAQQLADYFGVSVYAFLTRTFYGDILRQRDKATSRQLSKNLKKLRATGGDFSVYKLSDEHEALPHPGLADGLFKFGSKREGTNGFALWRKQGGRMLPSSGEPPTGLTKGLVKFTPKEKRE